MLAYFLQGLPLGLSAAGQPGPFQAFLLGQSIKRGWKHTFPAAFAPLISDIPIVIVTVLILSQMPSGMMMFIRLAGGVFLLYLAYQTFRETRHEAEHQTDEPAEGAKLFQAATINILSPGAWLFWSTISGPILITGWRQATSNGVAFLIGFYGAMIAATLVLVFVFSMAHAAGPRLQHVLSVVSSILLGGFGMWQIASGLIALM